MKSIVLRFWDFSCSFPEKYWRMQHSSILSCFFFFSQTCPIEMDEYSIGIAPWFKPMPFIIIYISYGLQLMKSSVYTEFVRRIGRLTSDFWQEQQFFFSPKHPETLKNSLSLLSNLTPGPFRKGLSSRNRQLMTRSHLVFRSGMRGSLPPPVYLPIA
jgi:hypothetical protein